MDALMLVMRLVHVLLGVFWAGTLMFTALFLTPSIRDAGPEGAKVAAGLLRRRFLDVMPVVALLTILSGLWLYWRVSGGFQPTYVHSAAGVTLAIGALAAILALTLGLAILRPSMLRAAALSQTAATAAPAEREAQLATAQALRARAAGAGRVVALLLAVAVATMALARYL
jgi:hypothetical protein